MANNRINLIDPNNFVGSNILPDYGEVGYNMSVPLENLNIFVELETYTKTRTVLTTTAKGTSAANQGTTGKISFIEGTVIDKKKYLTTSYTELTTDLSFGSIDENLGITDISIDFSSSYAPMVTIQFIDVRGSAVFQKNVKSKYAVFFQLPYPIFSLKIKGYYGKPVQYCLHMTKVNSKFNSQTGNFEITASFVGYTYAMLSDMLIGYLKAIPYTKLGKDIFAELSTNNILSLNQLMVKLSLLQISSPKVLASDQTYIDLQALNNLIPKIDEIRKLININILLLSDLKTSVTLKKLESQMIMFTDDSSNTKEVEVIKTTYITQLSKLIDEYNLIAPTKYQFNIDIFRFIKYENMSYDKYDNNEVGYLAEIGEKSNITDVSKLRERGNVLLKLINGSSLANNTEVTVYDFNNQQELLNKTAIEITTEIDDAKLLVATKIKEIVTLELGFSPSIRNIVSIFTAHIEAFFKILFEVSVAAKNKTERTEELNNIKDGLSDINTKLPNYEIYPWPEYTKDGVETYLGTRGILENPLNVPEIEFVEDLYNGIIQSAIEQEALNKLLENGGLPSWIPVNPIDTTLINSALLSPFKRAQIHSTDDIVREVMLRAITFLGISNLNLPTSEIQEMAVADANELLIAMVGDTNNLVEALSLVTSDIYTSISGEINGINRVLLEKVPLGGASIWKYNYLFPDNEYNVISLSQFTGNFTANNGTIPDALTNYCVSDVDLTIEPVNAKVLDDGTYIKIIDDEDYSSGTGLVPNSIDTNLSTINLAELGSGALSGFDSSKLEKIGFKTSAGKLGIQELSQINWTDSSLNTNLGSSLNLIFYKNYIGEQGGLGSFRRDATGLSSYRKKDVKTEYDLTETKILVATIDTIIGKYDPSYALGTVKDGNNGNYDDMGKNYYWFSNMGSATYPYINFTIKRYALSSLPLSLFGSHLYNCQKTNEAKAFLFLHSLPWNGLQNPDGIFGYSENSEIFNLFAYRAAFIKAPSLWVAFIGGLFWRYEEGWLNEVINFYDDNGKLVIPLLNKDDDYPRVYEYMSFGDAPMSFLEGGNNRLDKYRHLGLLLKLPQQVRDEFKDAFLKFVSMDFPSIQIEFELFDTYATFKTSYDDAITNANGSGNIDVSIVNSLLKSSEYNIITPIMETYTNDGAFQYNFFLQNKDNSSGVRKLKDYLIRFKWIANTTFRIWNLNNTKMRKEIFISEKDIKEYVDSFITTINTNKDKYNKDNQVKEAELAVFGSNDNLAIKLNIYRTLKAIYDKWVAGNSDANTIMFPNENLCSCGHNNRKGKDDELAARRNDVTRLIDSFRFIDRAFNDIGDKFIINPLIIIKSLMNSTNQSFYDFLSRLLTDNNFDFVALPSFINYNSAEELESVFKPIPYEEFRDTAISGPSFVCVYVGQTSTKLDFGTGSEYDNDGVDFNNKEEWPIDFKNTLLPHEDAGAAFIVRYGQQNQNIFNDIILDQSEFSETDESLQITNALSLGSTDSAASYAGQNLYNVFSVRSYKAEVEMLGNAMIQPMMYFQLSNIPMFHGGYLITSVKHNIKPNFMSTRFTGVRIKKTATPLIDESILFASILNGYGSLAGAGGGGGKSSIITRNSLLKCLSADNGKYRNFNEWLTWIKTAKGKHGPFLTTDETTDVGMKIIKDYIIDMCNELNILPDAFVAILNVESYGGDPKARNSQGCVGIIQFCPFGGASDLIRKGFVKTSNEILTKTFTEQLVFTKFYLQIWNKKYPSSGTRNLVSSYLLILNPKSSTRGLTDPNEDLRIGGQQANCAYADISDLRTITSVSTANNPTSASAIIMGDSTVTTLINTEKDFIGTSKSKIALGYAKVKLTFNQLVEQVKLSKQNDNIITVFASIGLNNMYNMKENEIKDFIKNLKIKYPKVETIYFIHEGYWNTDSNNIDKVKQNWSKFVDIIKKTDDDFSICYTLANLETNCNCEYPQTDKETHTPNNYWRNIVTQMKAKL